MSKIRAVCVFCGSSSRGDSSHAKAAVSLGQALAKDGIKLIYGGGRVGLMGTVADAAITAGGEVIGVIPKFLDEYEVGHTGVTSLEVVDSMHTRKARMAELCDAFVALPGGLGTLEELFEIMTWKQLGLHDKPIVIADIGGYWAHLRALIDGLVTGGYATPENAAIVEYVSDVNDVLPTLRKAPAPKVSVESKWL